MTLYRAVAEGDLPPSSGVRERAADLLPLADEALRKLAATLAKVAGAIGETAPGGSSPPSIPGRRANLRRMHSSELAALFRRDITRLLQETRAFPDTAALWRTAPGVTNAAGTLVLHLEGNLREYIGRQLGGIDYVRDRPLEFSARDIAQDELVGRIEAVRDLIPPVISRLTPETLDAAYPELYNGAAISTAQFLIHLFGHLSYHLGQIDYLRRITTGSGAIALATL